MGLGVLDSVSDDRAQRLFIQNLRMFGGEVAEMLNHPVFEPFQCRSFEGIHLFGPDFQHVYS